MYVSVTIFETILYIVYIGSLQSTTVLIITIVLFQVKENYTSSGRLVRRNSMLTSDVDYSDDVG